MSDLIERLRGGIPYVKRVNDWYEHECVKSAPKAEEIMREAADALAQRDARIEELEAALGNIAAQLTTRETTGGDIEYAYDKIIEVARAALPLEDFRRP